MGNRDSTRSQARVPQQNLTWLETRWQVLQLMLETDGDNWNEVAVSLVWAVRLSLPTSVRAALDLIL